MFTCAKHLHHIHIHGPSFAIACCPIRAPAEAWSRRGMIRAGGNDANPPAAALHSTHVNTIDTKANRRTRSLYFHLIDQVRPVAARPSCFLSLITCSYFITTIMLSTSLVCLLYSLIKFVFWLATNSESTGSQNQKKKAHVQYQNKVFIIIIYYNLQFFTY